MKTYKEVNGISYSKNTTDEVIKILEIAKKNKARIRLTYGNPETGLDWGEEHDIEGYVGCSMGPMKIPLLVYNARSMGGGGILTDCIVKIEAARGKAVLYQNPKYHKEADHDKLD